MEKELFIHKNKRDRMDLFYSYKFYVCYQILNR
jgi:hypothetical protein